MSEDQGLFSDVDFAEGDDNMFGFPNGIHEVVISGCEKTRSEKGNLGLWLTFSNDHGKSIRRWISLPEKEQDPETRSRNTGFLKLALNQLEIPKERWSELTPDDFEGIECVITVQQQKKNPEYQQVSKMARKKSYSVHGQNAAPGFDADALKKRLSSDF